MITDRQKEVESEKQRQSDHLSAEKKYEIKPWGLEHAQGSTKRLNNSWNL